MKTSPGLGLLLLHALPLDSRMWHNQLEIMPERTVAPDLYEFGSDIETWAAQSLDLVAQDQFVVVGCSVGGSCALEVMNRAPDRVAAAVLIGTKARCDPNPAAQSEACRTVLDHGVKAAWARYWHPLFANAAPPDIAQQAKEIALNQSPEELTWGLTAFYTRASREHVVAESRVPIHLVTGDRDALPGLSYTRQLAGMSDKARLHVIQECGHYVPMMQPRALNSLIRDVLTEADTSFAKQD